MIAVNQIKIALSNMMRMAARDPLWATIALITLPLRDTKSFVKGAVGYLVVVFARRRDGRDRRERTSMAHER